MKWVDKPRAYVNILFVFCISPHNVKKRNEVNMCFP